MGCIIIQGQVYLKMDKWSDNRKGTSRKGPCKSNASLKSKANKVSKYQDDQDFQYCDIFEDDSEQLQKQKNPKKRGQQHIVKEQSNQHNYNGIMHQQSQQNMMGCQQSKHKEKQKFNTIFRSSKLKSKQKSKNHKIISQQSQFQYEQISQIDHEEQCPQSGSEHQVQSQEEGYEEQEVIKQNQNKLSRFSLQYLTQQFIDLIKYQPNMTVNLNAATQKLNTQKRRIYDITNILEGVNYIEKSDKNIYRWRGQEQVSEQTQNKLKRQYANRILRALGQELALQEQIEETYKSINEQLGKTNNNYGLNMDDLFQVGKSIRNRSSLNAVMLKMPIKSEMVVKTNNITKVNKIMINWETQSEVNLNQFQVLVIDDQQSRIQICRIRPQCIRTSSLKSQPIQNENEQS